MEPCLEKVVEPRPKPTSESNYTHGKQGYSERGQPGKEGSKAYHDPGEILTRGKATRRLDLNSLDGAAEAWDLLESGADVW